MRGLFLSIFHQAYDGIVHETHVALDAHVTVLQLRPRRPPTRLLLLHYAHSGLDIKGCPSMRRRRDNQYGERVWMQGTKDEFQSIEDRNRHTKAKLLMGSFNSTFARLVKYILATAWSYSERLVFFILGEGVIPPMRTWPFRFRNTMAVQCNIHRRCCCLA